MNERDHWLSVPASAHSPKAVSLLANVVSRVSLSDCTGCTNDPGWQSRGLDLSEM